MANESNNIVGIYVKSNQSLYDETLVIRKSRLSYYASVYNGSGKKWYSPQNCRQWRIFPPTFEVDDVKHFFGFDNADFIGKAITC